MIALAIMVTSGFALYESFSLAINRIERAANLQESALLAASIRDRVGGDLDLSEAQHQGHFGGCRWRVQIQPITTNDDEPPEAAWVETSATCGNGDAKRSTTLPAVEWLR